MVSCGRQWTSYQQDHPRSGGRRRVRRVVIEAGVRGAPTHDSNAPSPRETTHRHHTPPVTRRRPRVDLAAQLGAAAAVVARNRLHPFSASAANDDVGGRAIVLRIHVCFTPGL